MLSVRPKCLVAIRITGKAVIEYKVIHRVYRGKNEKRKPANAEKIKNAHFLATFLLDTANLHFLFLRGEMKSGRERERERDERHGK